MRQNNGFADECQALHRLAFMDGYGLLAGLIEAMNTCFCLQKDLPWKSIRPDPWISFGLLVFQLAGLRSINTGARAAADGIGAELVSGVI
jgi:hypothetical protein